VITIPDTSAPGVLEAWTSVAATSLETASPEDVLDWARSALPRFAVTSSFGADSAVLLHLLARVDRTVPVLFLETGFHFAETLQFRRDLVARLGLTDVRDVRPGMSVEAQARAHGGGLYLRDPDRCCEIRKVAPLDDALAGFDGWASGVRRDQTADRASTPVVGTARKGDRLLVKVAPLATWTASAIDEHLAAYALPRHPLADAGFPSIGCAPCTRRVADGEDSRAGRWAGMAKTECGIHLELPDAGGDRPTAAPTEEQP
jgi:phosphoadenosine phosphosulfate reductase